MKNYVTRQCINPDVKFYEHDVECDQLLNIFDYEDFCFFIDQWKVLLVKKYKVKPGQTISACAGPNMMYYALIFATAELGLILIVDWPYVTKESDLNDVKLSIHGKIDFVYTHKRFHTPGDNDYNKWLTQRDLSIGNEIIYTDDVSDYFMQITEQEIAEVSALIHATEDSTLIYSCSSGSTGSPKRIINSHKKVYLMSKRIAQFVMEPNASVCHTSLLHHGSSASFHFLPGLMHGKEQYTCVAANGSVTRLAKFVQENKINQLFLYTHSSLTEFVTHVDVLEHKVNILTLQQITKNLLPLIKQKKINFVKSSFGDSTIGDTFFLKTVDQYTDEDTYDVSNMGPQLDNFYQFEIRNNLLYVASQQLDQDWVTSNDLFCVVDGNYYFQGRSNQYRINGCWIELNKIEEKVNELFGFNGANIVFDPDMQKIYLAVWEQNETAVQALHQFVKDTYKGKLKISHVLKNESYINFLSGRKLNQNKIRLHCRNKLLEGTQ
jgi:acyl-coenzyme A synthetase/AMP-(fatty) acid ligase